MGDARTPEQIREHYEIEKELAARLRGASATDRPRLYAEVYDELFARVPHHPQLWLKQSAAERAYEVAWQLRLLSRFVTPATRFLEIGAGDCALSLALAPRVQQVTAMDVSATIAALDAAPPANFRRVLADRLAGAVPPGSVDVAYSNQMIEHLHPDDAAAHARDVHAALAPGGVYICITPNGVSGPHDVSAGFDPVATGLHLREYTAADLARVFRAAGFARCAALVGPPRAFVVAPVAAVTLAEGILSVIPRRPRRVLAEKLRARTILGLRLVAWK